MSKNNQNELPITSQEKAVVCGEAKNKEKNENSSGVDKQKVTRRRKGAQLQNEATKESKTSPDDFHQPQQPKQVELLSQKADQDKLCYDHESEVPLIKKDTKSRKRNPKISNTDKSYSLTVGGSDSNQTASRGSQSPKCKNSSSSQGVLSPPVAKSTPSVNRDESFDGCSDVPYQSLERRPKISLAVIGPSSTTLSEDVSDSHNPSDLTDPLEEYAPTRYENNSSYAAAIKGGMSLSISDSCKGALETSCSSSIVGSNESLKHDYSQFDDQTLRSISVSSYSPKMMGKSDNTSPLPSGHCIIPLITTNAPRKYSQTRLSPVSPARSLRKYSQGSRFSRQQSQPSPKDHRYHCRGIRRSISNKITAEEEAMLRHVCSFGGIDSHGKSACCLHMHQCCSLHNCGNPADSTYAKEGHGDQGMFSCNYLHVQNEPNSPSMFRHDQQTSRICRNMGCRETTTHVIGSGMCVGLDPDSIANIAFESMKSKGATKKFNQVCVF